MAYSVEYLGHVTCQIKGNTVSWSSQQRANNLGEDTRFGNFIENDNFSGKKNWGPPQTRDLVVDNNLVVDYYWVVDNKIKQCVKQVIDKKKTFKK